MPRTLTLLVRSATIWMAVGLVGGLYYRTLTHSQHFTGRTQLAIVHTHALTLGMVMMLIFLVLEKLFTLSADGRFKAFFWTYTASLIVTNGMQWVKGTLQVLKPNVADSPALAGISGLGHMGMTVAFVLFFLVLGARVKTTQTASTPVAEPIS